jgi:DNA polymerase-4
VLAAARSSLASMVPLVAAQGCTLVGVSVGNLDDADAVQLALPFDRRTDPALDGAIDAVRDKFGSTAVKRAVLLDRAPLLEMPMLPD